MNYKTLLFFNGNSVIRSKLRKPVVVNTIKIYHKNKNIYWVLPVKESKLT